MRVQKVNVGEIDDTDRSRVELGDLDGLKVTIQQHGLYQPITVYPHPNGGEYKYKLVAGGRRLAAFRDLGESQIDAVVRKDFQPEDALEVEYLENYARKDFTWQERVELTYKINNLLIEKAKGKKTPSGIAINWGLRQTAKLIGKSYGGVQRHIQLYKLMQQLPELKEMENEDKAVKAARTILEHAEVRKVRESQKKTLDLDDEEEDETSDEEKRTEIRRLKRIKNLTAAADNNYRIGNAFDGLREIVELRKEGISPPIALCEVDPPYGIDLLGKKKGEGKGKKHYNEIPTERYEAWLNELTPLLYEALPEDCHLIFWYGHEWYAEVQKALVVAGFQVDKIPCIWTKSAGQTAQPDRYLARAYEPFLYAWKGSPVLHKRGRVNVFNYPSLPAGSKYHPTQRPIDLMVELLSTFIFPGQIILSPFLGSGVTLLASYRLENPCFGWDLSERYKELFMFALDEEIKTFHLEGPKPPVEEETSSDV